MAEEINMSKHVNGSVLKAFGAKMLEYEKGITDAIDEKVDTLIGKFEGKSLVDDTEITKLSGVSANANHTEVSATLTEGVEVGTITIDGIATKLYVAPTEYLTVSEAEAIFNEIIAPTT